VGESVHAYVRRLRLERAALMPRHGGDSITDIALKSGYDDPASFTKAFTRMFETSPRSFRKRSLPLSGPISPDGAVDAVSGAAKT
jgi:AraC family transcriptional regulator